MNFTKENQKTRLFEVLSALEKSDRVVQDDTQLEKFLTFIENNVTEQSSADYILSHPDAQGFFNHAATAEIQDPFQSLILGLRLGPLLFTTSSADSCNASRNVWEISDEDIQKTPSWIEGMFSSALQTSTWEEGSVRNAWMTGLSTMCRTPTGLHWALNKRYLLKVVDSLFDSSIFVSNQAQCLLVSVLPALIKSKTNAPSTLPVSALSRTVCNELQDLLRMVFADMSYDINRMRTSLDLVKAVSAVVPPGSGCGFYFVNELLDLAKGTEVWSDRGLSNQLVTTMISVLTVSENSTVLQGKLEVLSEDLLQRRHITPAMTLAAQLLLKGSHTNQDKLQHIVLLPMTVLLGKQIPTLDDAVLNQVRAAFSQKTTYRQALLSSINFCSVWAYDKQTVVAPTLVHVLTLMLGHNTTAQHLENGEDNLYLRQALYNETKLQLALLGFFLKYLKAAEGQSQNHPDKPMHVQLFQECLLMFKKPGLPPTVSTRGFEVLMELIHILDKHSSDEQPVGENQQEYGDLLERFAELLLRSLCDVKWEVRDTAVSIIGKIIQRAQAGGGVMSWLETHRLPCQLWQSVGDGESYVRAAAVTALTNLPAHPSLWQQLIAYSSLDQISSKLKDILSNDKEAFTRRSTVKLLCKWLEMDALSAQSDALREAVNLAIYDLDWEVKLSVLAFWSEAVLKALASVEKPVLPDYASQLRGLKHKLEGDSEELLDKMLAELDSQGCLQCLIVGARDHDQSVRCKSCEVLVSVKDTCVKHKLRKWDSAHSEEAVKRQRLEQNASAGADIGHHRDIQRRENLHGPMTVAKFLQELKELDLDKLLEKSSESIDDYVRNPESLFQDILTSLAKTDEENAVDCY